MRPSSSKMYIKRRVCKGVHLVRKGYVDTYVASAKGIHLGTFRTINDAIQARIKFFGK